METVQEFDARIAVAQAEVLEAKLKIAKMRKERPLEPVKDYEFGTWAGGNETLRELFGDRVELIVIHNMGTFCDYCTLWADGFNGQRMHFSDRAAFVVISNDSVSKQQVFAASRGWEFKMVSSEGTTFFADMGFTGEDGGPWPGVSCFRKQPDGSVVRTGHESLGEGDDFCPVWHVFALFGDEFGGWSPKVAQPTFV